MKIISVYDTWNGKFASDIVDHWRSKANQVKFNGQYKENDDIAFFYQADNAAQVGVRETNAQKIFVQCVDIEVWAGQADAIDWSKVSGAIFMAKHIQDKVKTPCPQILIKPGIDLKKFTFKKKPPLNNPVRRIAYVVGNGRIWDVKRFDIALQILRDLLDTQPQYVWQLHVRGTYSSHEQYNAYCRHLQKDLRLDDFVVWYPDRVEDMNDWYEEMDYFLLPSTKEAFSYATAEAMAKGIKPIIGNWESAKDTWGKYACETYGQMMLSILRGTYEPDEYRKYVETYYDQERYFKDLDAFIGV